MKHRDLFISHSAVDGETAAALAVDFENRGITCWLAPRDVPFGGTYQAEIVRAIEDCRAMLLLFSHAANKSEHILREVELAAQANKPIYPLRIDKTEPAGGLKYMLANKQWVERQALGDRLVDTVEQLLGRATPAEGDRTSAIAWPPPKHHGGVRNQPLIAAAGILAVCLLLGAGWFVTHPGWTPWSATSPPPTTTTPPITPTPGPQAQGPTTPPIPAPTPAPGAAPTPTPQPIPTPTPPTAGPDKPVPVPAADEPKEPKAEPRPEPQPKDTAEQPSQQSEAPPTIVANAPADARALGAGVHLFRECTECPVMAVVPAGKGLIGSPPGETGRTPDEGPQQEVVFSQPFAVGRTEISFDEWGVCLAEGGCNAFRPADYEWGRGKHPVINVSWVDAKAYVAWLSHKTGANYRLLSEAEWEYAARGCMSQPCPSTPFWFGFDITPSRANYDWRYSYAGSPRAQPPRRTVEIDKSEPNPFGLLHVHGNVREWVEDCWNPTLAGLPPNGSARLTGDCSARVVRGGSWGDEPKDLRLAKRLWFETTEKQSKIGFRVARSLIREAQSR